MPFHFASLAVVIGKSVLVESRTTLLSNELKRHLFNLFASWSGPTAKPLGFLHAGFGGTSSNGTSSTACASINNSSLGISGTNVSGTSISLGNTSVEEEKLQFSALQVSQCLEKKKILQIQTATNDKQNN